MAKPRLVHAVLALGLSASGAVALVVAVPARGLPEPVHLRDAAALAHAEAVSATSATWARVSLEAAERALRAARLEETVQSSRLAWRRDYAAAARGYESALANARIATALARRRSGDAETRARRSLAAAEEVLSLARRLREATALSPGVRAAIARAAIDLDRSRGSLEAGDFLAASERAAHAHAVVTGVLEAPMAKAARYARSDDVVRWRAALDGARRWSRNTGLAAVVVVKDEHRLLLLERGRVVEEYPIELGRNALPPKQHEGDRATPEGEYRITRLKDRGQTRYHRALLVDYPNAEDRRRFAERVRRGEIPRGTGIGGLIEIHGEGGRGWNWTDGCVALRNPDMDALFSRVAVGTPVTIIGGRGGGVFSGVADDWERLDRQSLR